MNVLVTGAAGFIGSHLVDALLARGDRVVGVDSFDDYYSPAQKRSNLLSAMRSEHFELHTADIRSDALADIVSSEQFDAIAHLAALAGVRYSIERAPLYVDVNVRGTVNVLESARIAGIPHDRARTGRPVVSGRAYEGCCVVPSVARTRITDPLIAAMACSLIRSYRLG